MTPIQQALLVVKDRISQLAEFPGVHEATSGALPSWQRGKGTIFPEGSIARFGSVPAEKLRMQTMNSQQVKISDVHLASYLLVRGFPIVRVEGTPGRREFVFTEVPPEIISSFYGGDDSVSARALLDALRNVRGLLVQGVR